MLSPAALRARLDRDLTVFDPTLCLAAAEHALAVYRPGPAYVHAMVDAGYTGAELIEAGWAQCGIAWSPEVIVVAHRGSSERGDWRSNLRAMLWRCGWEPWLPRGCRVGWGWKQQAEAMQAPLAALLRSLDSAPIVVVGHSLGGPLVSVSVPWIAETIRPPATAITFASPRAGNRAWADFYTDSFDRGMLVAGAESITPSWGVVLSRRGTLDPVARVPPRRWFTRHVGRRVILEDGVAYLELRGWRWRQDQHPVGHLAAWRILSRALIGVGAHPMAQYTAALSRLGGTP